MHDRPEKVFHVYITASSPRGVLYVGMTSDLAGRAWNLLVSATTNRDGADPG